MTEKNTDPLAAERERRRKRELPNSGGTYRRASGGLLAKDDDGVPLVEPDSVTADASGKSAARRAMYAADLRDQGVDAEQAFQMAHAASSVPSPRSRRGAPLAADETNGKEV